jgi:hypothetical protein
MTGAHHATIAGLVARVRALEGENSDLELEAEDLHDMLAATTVVSDNDTPRQTFTALRRALISWPRSDWHELGRLIALYVDEF